MGRERWKREHALPRFPFHCYTNPAIESQNLVVRSKYTIVYHTAEAVSETAGLDEPRDLLEFKAGPEILRDLERFEAAVAAYQRHPICRFCGYRLDGGEERSGP